MYPNEHLRYTTITWDEYQRLTHESEILDFLERQYKRKKRISLRAAVEEVLASKRAVQTILAKAVKLLDDPSRPADGADQPSGRLDFFEPGRPAD